MKKATIVLLLLCFSALHVWVVSADSAASNSLAGFKTIVSNTGIAYLKDVGIGFLEEYLSVINVAPISGLTHSSIGAIEYTLSSVVLSSLTVPSSSVRLSQNTSSAQLKIVNASAHATLDWNFKVKSFPHLTDVGTAYISIINTAVNVSVQIGAINGRPYAKVMDVDIHIGDLDINVYNEASWVYNLYVGDLADDITDDVSEALSSSIRDAINDGANKALASLPIVEQINDDLVIDYSLVDLPKVADHYLALAHRGEFYATSHPIEAPFTSIDLPDIFPDSPDMVTMYISDYVANTIAFSLFVENYLKVVLADSDLPDESPLRMNTTYFQDMVPPLFLAYPDMLMELHVSATQPPYITFDQSGATLVGKGVVDVYVVPAQNLAFSLAVDLYCTGTAGLNQMNITGNLQLLTVSFTLQSSPIGTFEVQTLQAVVNAVFSMGVLPIANKFLKHGFALPTITGLTFADPVVGWSTRFLSVSANIIYNPNAKKMT